MHACRPPVTNPMEGVAWVQEGPHVTMLKRIENEGMDFAAHNTSMTYSMKNRDFWGKYKYELVELLELTSKK